MAFSLKNFNAAQQKVITNDTGPLLVISGAGTGKTHVLTGRILHLILEKHIPANQILALTFNEKAATEMLERVDQQLPLGHPEVSIHTFHGFCERVLRERGLEIGIPGDYKIVQDADLWMILRQHQTEFKLNYFHSLGNPQKFFMELKQYISRLQDEDISPEAYTKYVEAITTSAKSDEEKELVSKHGELARAYETYAKILLKNHYMDFSGLVYYTLRLFEKRASVLADYQRRYSYLFVDEFQDTNYSQNKIVSLLAKAHTNLCVVGDDDQSIYKWRGASLTNIQYFHKQFPGAATVVLNENYRSTQPILDAAYSLIQNNNPDRLEVTQKVDKKLIAAKTEHVGAAGKAPPILGGAPEVAHFSELDDEVNFVITKAASLVRKGANVAILVRTNALAKPFIEALSRRKLPFQHFSSANVWDRHAVKDCMALLRVLADPWDDIALFRLAALPFWNIPMEKLLEKMKSIKGNNASLFDALQDGAFTEFRKTLNELIEFSRTHRVGEVLGKFLNDIHYLEKTDGPDDSTVEDIAAFSEKVAAFEETHPHAKVMDFLLYAQLLEETNEGSVDGGPLDPSIIKVMTVHASKGLEFDAVFLPGIAQNKFPTINRRDPFEVPKELIPEPLPEGDHHMQEERRLFYVAMTRAKEYLTITYSDFYDGKRQWKPSIFITELLQAGRASEKNLTSNAKRAKQQITLPFEEGSKKRLILPRLSYSQLDTFSTCPLKYQFRYLFELPAPLPAAASFGTSVHNTLRAFYELLQQNLMLRLDAVPRQGRPEKKDADLTRELTRIYEENWVAQGYENRAVQDDQKKRGLEMVLAYYEKEKSHIMIPAFLEESFSLTIDNLTISGRIDRIDRLSDGTYEVIDYKTGKIDKNLKNNLQLSLYALACRDVLKLPVSSLSLYSVSTLEKVSTTRSESDLEKCKQELISLASEMANSDFTPTPGFHCRFCEYRLICPVAA